MKHSGPGITALDVWNLFKSRENLGFIDEFNRAAEDTDIWTSGGDAGTFTPLAFGNVETIWELETGVVIDQDRYIHGDVKNNKSFTPYEAGFTTVTWKTRLATRDPATFSALWGLFLTPPTDYAEPASQCAHFLADPAITNTFRARSYTSAEEETDTLVAIDSVQHEFAIVWTATAVLFYIDDVLVATHTTRVPNYPLTSVFLIRTEAAVKKRLALDLVHVEVT